MTMTLASGYLERDRGCTYHEVPQQDGNGDLADRGDVDGGLFLDGRPVKVLVRGKVDAHGAVADELGGHLERLDGDAADDDVAEGQAVLEAPALLVLDLVARGLDALAAGEELDAGDVDAVDGGAVVGQQGGQGPAVDLGAVDDGNGLAEEAVAGGEDGVVDLQVLEDLDDGEGRAGQDRLLLVLGRVEEAHVVVHVVQVLVAHTLDVLGEVDRLLDVLVVRRVLREDGVVDDDAVDDLLVVGLHDFLLENLLVDGAEVKVEATAGKGLVSEQSGMQTWARQRGTEVGAYLSSHVFLDHSAYLTAAGSPLARKAASVGWTPPSGPWTLASVSLTSASRPLAMVSAVMTLQVLGTSWAAMAIRVESSRVGLNAAEGR